MYYIVKIKRPEGTKVFGYNVESDQIIFDSEEELENFQNGRPSCNWLNDSISPLKKNEQIVGVETVKNLEFIQ